MSRKKLDEEAMAALVAARPVTITMRLSSDEVELALASEGASLRAPAMMALLLAKVLDVDYLAA